MSGLFFSISLSISIITLLLVTFKGMIVRRYGFRMMYMMTMIIAIRFLIPYSFQLPYITRPTIRISETVVVFWAVGVVCSLVIQSAKYYYCRNKILCEATVVREEDVLCLLEETKVQLFVDDVIGVIRSKAVTSPMLMGIRKPIIVLPMAKYTSAQMRMLFLHELTHWKHKDTLKKCLFLFVTALQWFNPLAYLLQREAHNSMECLCDEAVVKHMSNREKKEYCYMIVDCGADSTAGSLAVSYLSMRRMIEMRIGNIFSGKKKSGGSLLVVTVLCTTLLSGLLGGCVVETPGDVLDEMDRIEGGLENEQGSQGVTNFDLTSVSEVTSSVNEAIEAMSAVDGIFKFDNCRVIIPEVNEMVQYVATQNVGVETAEKRYAQMLDIEKKWFTEGTFDMGNSLFVPMDQSNAPSVGRLEYTFEEYMKSDGMSVLLFKAPKGKYGWVQLNGHLLWMMSSAYIEEDHRRTDADPTHPDAPIVETIECLNKDVTTLTQEYRLSDGNMKVSDAIAYVEKELNELEYYKDNRITVKVARVYVKECVDNTFYYEFEVLQLIDSVPVVSLVKNHENDGATDEIKVSVTGGMNHAEVAMMHTTGTDMLDIGYCNMTFSEKKTISEILSVEQVFRLVKNKFSNEVVYSVEELRLGYITYNLGEDYVGEVETWPVYNIRLYTNGYELSVSVNAVTGEMNYFREYR